VNWDAIGAISESLGALGVIVTLVYLGTQIRQNSRLLRASTSSVTTAAINTTTSLITQDREVARIYWSGLADRGSLSESERQRFDSLVSASLFIIAQEYAFLLDGALNERVWRTRVEGLKWQLRQRGVQQWWGDWSVVFDSEFQQFVNELLHAERSL
jgi:hypothetical protein